MTQSRFWLSSHGIYEEAQKAKSRAENDNSEGVYQIRKGVSSEGAETFRLVQRFKSNEVDVIKDTKSKKRGKKNAVDVSWVRG